MIPVVFINCKEIPFVDLIMQGKKIFETRNRNTLGALVGRRVLIAETGHGKPIVRCSAEFYNPTVVHEKQWWEWFRESTCVTNGSKHDWNDNTKCKWLYPIGYVEPVYPFVVPEGKRHGRVWMEYDEDDDWISVINFM